MESQAQFDLNDAIHRWRRNLERLPALSARDTEELESHLRDSIATLRVRGLTLEEAFIVASQRLGPPQQLEREYGKMNPQGVWMERGLWMIVGVLYYWLACSCASAASASLSNVFMSWSMNGRWCALISVLAKWIVEVASVVVFLRLVTRHSEQGARFVNLCLRRPLLPMLGIVVLNYSRMRFSNSLEFSRVMGSMPRWSDFVELAVVIFVILLCNQRRLLDGCSPKPQKCGVETLPPPLRDKLRTLQSAGLSPTEAALIVARRQGQSSESIDISKYSETRRVWLERCHWMLNGILISGILWVGLNLPFRMVVEDSTPFIRWLPSFMHWPRLLLACIDITVTVSLVALLWRFVTGHEKLAIRIALLGMRRPVFGGLGLMLLLYGFFLLLGLLGKAAPLVPVAHRDHFYIALGWINYGFTGQSYVILFNAVPVLLLFLLGRYRMKLEPAT